jgi:transposase-like protein
MSDTIGLNGLSQSELGEAGKRFYNIIREVVRETIFNTLADEVASLCGPKHEQGVSRDLFRNGSTSITCSILGNSEVIKKPRVRKNKADGTSEEVSLATYEGIKDATNLEDIITKMLTHGVSCRDVSAVLNDQKTTSRSNVSRLLISEGAKKLEEFRSRDLSNYDFIAITLDGIYLSSDICVIAALGITMEGHKVFLDFEIGSSENSESVQTLMGNVISRGFTAPSGLICTIDGAKALKKGVLRHFPNAVIQRCLIHKERNIKSSLARKHWGKLSGLFSSLRKAQGKEAGEEKFKDIETFLKDRNKISYDSLLEAKDELLALHRLNIPSSLNPSLLNTNIIENSFRNVRGKIGRVTRWRVETNQPSNWMALAITHIEKGFKRIKGYKDLGCLKEILLAQVAVGNKTTQTSS